MKQKITSTRKIKKVVKFRITEVKFKFTEVNFKSTERSMH